MGLVTLRILIIVTINKVGFKYTLICLKQKVGCFVRGDRNGMGCFVRGGKNCMGCFVRGDKSMWDVLSGVSKNGMGCFVPGCFVLHSDPNTTISGPSSAHQRNTI